MEWIVLIIIFIFINIPFIKKYLSFKFSIPPSSLELKPIEGLQQISDDLENALDDKYMKNVEERVRAEVRLKYHEYEWRILDLKRYFILTSLLKERNSTKNKKI